jgi:hypothetical protein
MTFDRTLIGSLLLSHRPLLASRVARTGPGRPHHPHDAPPPAGSGVVILGGSPSHPLPGAGDPPLRYSLLSIVSRR